MNFISIFNFRFRIFFLTSIGKSHRRSRLSGAHRESCAFLSETGRRDRATSHVNLTVSAPSHRIAVADPLHETGTDCCGKQGKELGGEHGTLIKILH